MNLTRWLSMCCLLAAACDRTPAAKPDTAAGVVEESHGALAERYEAQECFDSARSAFVRQDWEACITRLAEAAAFFRAQSRAANREARPALDAAAEEIETFLANVANGERRTPKDLDRVYAQAHAAESGQHLARARSAFTIGEDVRAGEELLMSIDHLERAARDARRPRDSAVHKAVADTRPLATEMVKGMDTDPDDVTRVSAEIETAIRRIVASIEVPRLKAP
jgi:hypothetical protein